MPSQDRALDPDLDVLVRKLELSGPLSPEDRLTLETCHVPIRQVEADCDLVGEGDRPAECQVLLEGFGCRYKGLSSGARQIVAFLVPGDICNLEGALLGRMDHSAALLTRGKVASLSQATVLEWAVTRPDLSRRLWRDTVVDAAIYREWLVNVGRRTAYERVAHLLCELLSRLRAVGLAAGNSCHLPLTQAEIADATGLSTVHVNRTIQQLRGARLIELRGPALAVLDWHRLTEDAAFDPTYLHHLAPRFDAADGRTVSEPRPLGGYQLHSPAARPLGPA